MNTSGWAGLVLPGLVALVISLVLGHFTIPLLRRIKAGQEIREEGPKSHLAKAGTPTIGGVIFLASSLICLLAFRVFDPRVGILVLSTLGFGLIGFIDDYIKVVNKRNLGFTSRQKLLAQVLVALVLTILVSRTGEGTGRIFIPILKQELDLGLVYFPLAIFVMVGTVNAVNLTDGLDGLCSTVTLVVLAFFALVAYRLGQDPLTRFAIILMGGLVGFLYYNHYPARVFMGDTGSLALGGAVVALALVMGLPLILPIAGGIYFIEALSVIIQVISFKTRGKRVFLMSPLHHHFEHLGYSEIKIVGLFAGVQVILCILAYLMIF